MTEASPQVDGPESKRRKVRKGTRNCWECKRRKVRCTFAATTDAICENCRRRGTACISQEQPDEPMVPSESTQVEARLGRVEELIEHLVHGAVTGHIHDSPAEGLSEGHLAQLKPRCPTGHTSDRCACIPSSAVSEIDVGASFSCSGGNKVVCVPQLQNLTTVLC